MVFRAARAAPERREHGAGGVLSGPQVRVAAQAKLNLHLRVFSREESGYHSIETVFHRIDLSDDLVVEITGGERTLDVEGSDTGPADKNLAWRAASAYAEQSGWPGGFRISLTKRIPVGAGLGGGSADAAAVLRALNSLSPNPIGTQGLLDLAASLGSDVPFLAGNAVMALAWGHGERMLLLPPLPRREVLLMTPEFSVSTADAYRWLDEDRGKQDVSDSLEVDRTALGTWSSVAKLARNDFEPVIAARYPELRSYLELLKNSGAIFSQMTGSGSTIFGVFDSPPDNAKLGEQYRERVTTTRTSIDVVQPVRVG